ncbi:MAG: hypothetical protein LBI81_03295 [Puniceicoccales bacterium]|nr:hypothetical protein [Puniceicoccales bacterium]
MGHGVVIAEGRKAITIMEISEATCATKMNMAALSKVTFTTERFPKDYSAKFGNRNITPYGNSFQPVSNLVNSFPVSA